MRRFERLNDAENISSTKKEEKFFLP